MNREDLLKYLETDLSVDTSDVDDSTPLFSSGLIDSFSLVSMLTFIETECGFKVSPMDVNLDNMDSIERLMRFIGRNTEGSD